MQLLPSRPSILDSLAHTAIFRAIDFCVEKFSSKTIYCIDATCGNGHDTLAIANFLAKNQYSSCKLVACDIQEQALIHTKKRLEESTLSATLHLMGHEHIIEKIAEQNTPFLCAGFFNLGYLPGKDRTKELIITKPNTTLSAIKSFCNVLLPQGVISIHCYTGHVGGQEEYEQIESFVSTLPSTKWRVLKLNDVNKEQNKECLFILEKLQEKKNKSPISL